MTALLTLAADNLTLIELAAIFRRESSGLSQAAGRLQKRLLADRSLAARLERVKKFLKEPVCQA